jgi:hypothetical protein
MNDQQREWLTDFARKMQESADRCGSASPEQKLAKAVLVAKAGNSRFILEKLEKLGEAGNR